MRHIVIGDVHGNTDRFLDLMEQLEVPYEPGERASKGIKVIQLGDFLNLGYGQEEYDFWLACRRYIDVYLIGNHELPIVAPDPLSLLFVGFTERDRSAEEMLRDEIYNNNGWMSCAHAVGDWLITHAGVTQDVGNIGWMLDKNAQEAADELNDQFKQWMDGNKNDDIDALQAFHFHGDSIFWNRDVKHQYVFGTPAPYKQIIGHTPQVSEDGGVHSFVSDDLYIIDIGAKVALDNGIAALVTDNEGQDWELVEISGVPAS